MGASTIAITGASGFVGRALSRHLLRAGHVVWGVTRRPQHLVTGTRSVHVQELCELDPRTFSGADVVVHLAARVHVMTETAIEPAVEFQRVNVDGTRAVMLAAQASGVRHVVFVSSIKVNGESRDAPYTEADTPHPRDPYGRSKQDAEGVVRSGGADLAWTIIRPPLVYGPEVGGNFRRLLRLAGSARRWPLPLAGLDNLRSMIYVDNLADAIAATIGHPSAGERTFLVSDDHDVGVSDLFRRLVVALGGRPRLFPAPVAILRRAGALVGRNADLERMLGTLRINCSLIQSTIGWRPPIELDEGLRRTARWWRDTVLG